MIAMQLRLEDLSVSQAASAVQPLQDSIKSASSSVSIPNLVHQVRAPNPAVLFTQSPCRQESVYGSVQPEAAGTSVLHICIWVDGCALCLQGTEDLGVLLVNHFRGKVASTQTAGTCSATAQKDEDAAQVVQRLSSDKATGPKVLVVCGDAGGTLEDELTRVNAFSKALQAAFRSHVTAYVSDTSLQVCNHGHSMLPI